MPAVTIDGRTLSLDGRRMWLVAGTIEYARLPRAHWAARLRAARQAGLNCIETPAVWALHEPRPGVFKWDHDLDLPAFIREVAAHGMQCILRAGPYVGAGWELGGIPHWLLAPTGRRLRGSDPAYLAACARWLSTLCDKVSDLQAAGSSRRKLGPIVAVRCEHRWLCGDTRLGETYLQELIRYLREGGITVPIINTTNLFQPVESTIEAWHDGEHLFATMRQLRALHHSQPTLATGVRVEGGIGPVWGDIAPPPARPATRLIRALGECLAAGAQFTIEPFHAATQWGFAGGRTLSGGAGGEGRDGFACPSRDAGASPLSESGQRTPAYHAARRIATFCSSFERVLSGFDDAPAAATLAPPPLAEPATGKKASVERSASGGTASGGASGGAAVVHLRGEQGSVAVLFGDGSPGQRAGVILPDGSSLTVELGEHGIAWLLMDAHLVDRATLDWCSLSPMTLVGRSLVLVGPAGAAGMISINGSAIDLTVPKAGESPRVVEHEDVALVLLNEPHADAAYATADALFVGVGELDASGEPVTHPAFKEIIRISAQGQVSRLKPAAAPPARTQAKVAISGWSIARCDEFIEGHSQRFAGIPKPAALEDLGTPSGYGWLRLRWKSSSAKKPRAGFIELADRAHLFTAGEFAALLGDGPGASGVIAPLSLKTGENLWTILLDNLGRLSEGSTLGEPKGLWGHIYDLAPLRGAPKVVDGAPIDPLAWRSPLMGVDAADRTDPSRLTWSVSHRKQTPLALVLDPLPPGSFDDVTLAMVVVNNKPVRALTLSSAAGDRVLLTPDLLARGNNSIQIAAVGDTESLFAAIRKAATLHECSSCLTEKAEWSFAKWDVPAKSAWEPLAKASKPGAGKGRPAWWRGTFTPTAAQTHALCFDAAGLSKGQIFINGHNVARYWTATADGKPVHGQSRYLIPEPWLKPDAPNEIVLFDEHGFPPDRSALIAG